MSFKKLEHYVIFYINEYKQLQFQKAELFISIFKSKSKQILDLQSTETEVLTGINMSLKTNEKP